jgi:hypothetical protein
MDGDIEDFNLSFDISHMKGENYRLIIFKLYKVEDFIFV